MKVSTHTARLTTRQARARDIYDLLAPAMVGQTPCAMAASSKVQNSTCLGSLRACVSFPHEPPVRACLTRPGPRCESYVQRLLPS